MPINTRKRSPPSSPQEKGQPPQTTASTNASPAASPKRSRLSTLLDLFYTGNSSAASSPTKSAVKGVAEIFCSNLLAMPSFQSTDYHFSIICDTAFPSAKKEKKKISFGGPQVVSSFQFP